MTALEKYAAKAKLTEKLLEAIAKAKASAGKIKADITGKTKKDATESWVRAKKSQREAGRAKVNKGTTKQKAKKRRAKGKADAGEATAKERLNQAAASQKRTQQVAGGFVGLAGLGALGLGAKAWGKRSASQAAVKGTQSAAKRLGAMARKHKKPLAISGGVVGGAAGLKAILDKKKRKA